MTRERARARSLVIALARVLVVAVGVGLGACSAIIEPDPGRLGPGIDGGAGGTDAGSGFADGGLVDAAGRDAGSGPRDGGPIPGEDGGGVSFPDAGRDAGTACSDEPACIAGAITSCAGTTPCPLGCAPDGEARCARMIPSNVAEDYFDPSARSVELTATGSGPTVFDTTTCTATSASSAVADQLEGDTEVCVLIVHDLTLRSGAQLVVRGRRPLVIMASGDVIIETNAALDVSARGAAPGPGGAVGGNATDPDGQGEAGGEAGENVPSFDDGGGAGGAYCGAGGEGGLGGAAEGGEATEADPTALLIPLSGGSGGGRGPGSSNASGTNAGAGGGGGGTLQISALGEIRIDGFLLAGGGGGQGGAVASGANWGAGGGGGSGGGILLEAPSIVIGAATSGITTGGGGGGGSASVSSVGGPGQDGAATLERAMGGRRGGTEYGAFGGEGGGGTMLGGGPGASNARSGANGGGGGGGAGCVVYRTLSGALPTGAGPRTSGRVEPSLQLATIQLE